MLHPFGLHQGLPLSNPHTRQFFGQSCTCTNALIRQFVKINWRH